MKDKNKFKLRSLPQRIPNSPGERIAASSSWRSGKDDSAARMYDYTWQCYRVEFLALNPICAIRGEGCTLAATVVDHIKPHRGDRVLFMDQTNHQPACAHCHNAHKQREEQHGASRVVIAAKRQR